jgi:exodeoxyribonuclease VII small subunit
MSADKEFPEERVHPMAKQKIQAAGSEPTEELSFEASLRHLEEIVGLLEGGQLGLSESLAQYEQGVKYLKFCYRQLERAEQKIELLSGVDAEGRVQTQPFAEADMSLEEKQAARSRRRSRTTGPAEPAAEIDEPNSLF